jgi:cytochrome P450
VGRKWAAVTAELPVFVDEMVGAEMRDPYPAFAAKRRDEPVWFGTFLTPEMLPGRVEPRRDWMVFRYDDCARVLRNSSTFTSSSYAETIGLVFGRTILEMHGPEHRMHRNIVARAFTARSLARWEEEVIAPVCHDLIDRFVHRGQAELVSGLTSHFPVRVIARVLGLPEDDFGQFHRWANDLFCVASSPVRGLAASASLREYFKDIVEERRRHPGDDVISELVQAEVDGERLDDESVCSFLRILLTGGADTTYRGSGSMLFHLLKHAEQLEAVVADRTLVDKAIEESLRIEPPAVGIFRWPTTDTEIGGVPMTAGESVYLVIASANHDESRWDEPERFDIFRPLLPHLAFAHGPHVCLGAHLARMELRVLLNTVLDRLPGLRLDQEADDPHMQGLLFRSPSSLPVLFDPS